MESYAAALFACLSLVVVTAMPTDFNVGAVDLSTVMNKTTCPIVVHIDEDATRIPQRIKVFKCGADLQEHCRARVPEYECCHRRDGVRMACVEMQDVVQVYYPAAAEGQQHQEYPVPIGCACVMDPELNLEAPTP